MKKGIPSRQLFGTEEFQLLKKVFSDSKKSGKDFGYQGKYERMYTDKFCEFQGGGYADAVSSGTAAVYIALKSLDIKKGSDVIVSPVTDPGGVMPVVLAGYNPIVCDSQPNSYNMGPDQFFKLITDKTKAAIVTHLGGCPADIERIRDIANSRNILLIEDCSQAHGALYKNKRVGTFGNISVFSTMFSKNHATGGCGGIVYTQDERLYWRARAHADRGKDFNSENFDPKDPSQSLFPAFNFNLDELSCAIGYSTLARLQWIINKRYEICNKFERIINESSVLSPVERLEGTIPSFFFYPVKVDIRKLKISAEEYANILAKNGVWLNPKYKFVVCEWKWMKPYLKGRRTQNAIDFRNSSFNLLFHEKVDEEYLVHLRDVIYKTLKEYSI